jgi:hypothetical protein
MMTQIAVDPFSTEEMPSNGYVSHGSWEKDLFGISPEVKALEVYSRKLANPISEVATLVQCTTERYI